MPIFPDNVYNLIYADPPWKQTKGGKKNCRPASSGKSLDYNVLSLDEIEKHLRVAVEHSTNDSILFLWTIDKYLFEAESIAKGLGYKLHARMIWNKENGIPAAFTIRFGHEYLLFMYRGKFIPVAKEERGKILSVFSEKVKSHSKKPIIAYKIIERLYPYLKKIELYARENREGWDAWGDQVNEVNDADWE